MHGCDKNEDKALQRTRDIETFADPQIQAYHNAKNVQQVIDETAQRQQKAIDSE